MLDLTTKVLWVMLYMYVVIYHTFTGACVEQEPGDTCENYSSLVRSQGRCRDLTGCEHIVEPTEGACPICGKWLCTYITIKLCIIHST